MLRFLIQNLNQPKNVLGTITSFSQIQIQKHVASYQILTLLNLIEVRFDH